MKPQLKQFFGPSPRHGHPCIALRFPDDGGLFSLGPLARSLRESAIRLPAIDGPQPLPQLVGAVVHRLLARPIGPIWSVGSDDGVGWVHATFPVARILAYTMWLAYHAIKDPESPAVEGLVKLQNDYRAINPYLVSVQMAAYALNFDVTMLSEQVQIVQVGQCANARHMRELGNDRDPLTFASLSSNKAATVALLNRMGLPTTRATLANDAEAVRRAAQEIGFPCVIKPVRGGQGNGITTGIKNPAMLDSAIALGLRVSNYPLLIENHIDGDDHRILVIDGEVLWAYRRRAARIVGDGERTVLELVEELNEQRANIEGSHAYLKKIEIDERLRIHLRDHYALDLTSAPAKGRQLVLAGVANVATGGSLTDVTARMHPDNRTMARRVARLFRGNAVGIDFMTTDISRSWQEGGSAIIEVNATPGIVSFGDGCHAMRTLMPDLRSGTVPSFVICGTERYCDETSSRIAELLKGSKLAFASGHYLRNRPPAGQIRRGLQSEEIERLLIEPDAQALVITCRPEDLHDFGLPLQRADVLLCEDRAIAGRYRDHVGQAVSDDDQPNLADLVRGTLGDHLAPPVRRPTVEWLRESSKLRCWRLRAMPSAPFWQQIANRAQRSDGMLHQGDVLSAVALIVERRLNRAKRTDVGAKLTAAVPSEGWDHPYVDADLTFLNDDNPIATTEIVNEVVAVINRMLENKDARRSRNPA